MIRGKKCIVSANFDSGTFMNIGVSAPLRENQYTNSIQDEYGLSYKDFTMLEIMIARTVDRYITMKEKGFKDGLERFIEG